MYSMVELLELMSTEQAEELRLRVGSVPGMVVQGEARPIEGPAISAEDAVELLRSIANTRQMRELWEHGALVFIYLLRGSSPFLVHARIEEGIVELEVR